MTQTARIVFMGTPDFAVPSLRALGNGGATPELVVTQPDRPKGRGKKTVPTPVKSAALDMGCEVIQPHSLSEPDVTARLRDLSPDFFVVVAYGHFLTAELLSIPRISAINVHASLLPRYRGSAPIQRAVMDGEPETGVTTMKMDIGMDTGDILLSRSCPIDPRDTAGSLHDKLSKMGAELLIETIEGMLAGKIHPVPQKHGAATHAPMLKKEDGHIDWTLPVSRISCIIRGVSPWPGAFAFHNDMRLKIHQARPIPEPVEAAPGTVLKSFPGELRIATGNGSLQILEIQGASGKRLPVQDFLRGYRLSPGDKLS